MAQFCEDCPLRGGCIEAIEHIESRDVQTTRLNVALEFPLTTVIECVDINGNSSKLFTGVNTETIKERVNDCNGLAERKVKIIGLFHEPIKVIKVCGALGVRAADYEHASQYRKLKISES
jgi:hypothetical protein